jgi:uncharacterized RDD family membrane protein YckC
MAKRNEHIDSVIRVVTPENIAFEYRLAGPFRRLPALLIDYAILVAGMIILSIVTSLTVSFLSPGLAMALILLAWFVSQWFYMGLFETYMNGQTPGKRLVGLRVLTTDGQPVNGMQSIMRNFFRGADLFPAMPIIGLVVMSCNQRSQRLGDLVAGTIVVVERNSWLTGVAKLEDHRAIQLASYLPPNFIVSRQLARALATYVERRRFFSPLRRREVARHLGEPLLEKFGLPADTSYDLLLCALYYRTFIADRHEDEQRLAEAQSAALAANPFQNVNPFPVEVKIPPLPQEQIVGIPQSPTPTVRS